MTDTGILGANDTLTPANYLGPYEAWNFGIGKPYAFPALRRDDISHLTALVEYPSPAWIDEEPDTLPSTERRTRLPTIWGKDAKIPLTFWPIVIENEAGQGVTLRQLDQCLCNAVQTTSVDEPRFRLAFPVASTAMHEEISRWPGDPDWSPDPKVIENCPAERTINVLAVIDDGIPFAHQNFRAADGERSRIEFCWLQSADKDPNAADPSVLFGREYTRETMENLIRDYGDDEDALYRAAGAASDLFELGSAINRHVTHGAHIMDVAAGYDARKPDVPPEETRLIAVQLPNTIAWDTSGFGKDMYMLSAVHYILERAERIGAGYGVTDIRVVINFSYGFSAGRHDGASELEAAINEIVIERRKLGRPTAIVLPSGNTFMDRLHGEITDQDFVENSFEFTWRIQPNDRTSSYLEIWFPENFDPADFTVHVEAPFGKATAALELKPASQYTFGDPRNFEIIRLNRTSAAGPIGQLSLDNHRRTHRRRVLVALAPSEPDDPDLPAAPAGDWRIRLSRNHDISLGHPPIFLWIQRDADPEAFRSGSRQSYLHDPAYRKYDDRGREAQSDEAGGPVRRFGTINGLATGATTLIVSGCRPSAETAWEITRPVPSGYSSAGKVGFGNAVGTVDCTARADRSNILPGRIAAGTRSGSYAMVQGTSVAAPLVARRIAEAFATSPDDKVRAAEKDNYLSLLDTILLQTDSEEDRARLGRCLVL
ncbi:S8 family serine peptidase [Roseibium salinum]|uniref:S8 family serine peptidase n=1 Tax=Roseibium salinum TaxID=1604349 RepID=A0ABT3QWK0_9HYPH|nr:S8 family serine peptidase [Roseibium sp. DSM 29163]MCX2721320.1 S8 family serine peptidase [Roseibium sp. DSM 29163]